MAQSKPAPEMPDFLKKLMGANQNVICTASMDDVRKVNIDFLLTQRLKIPIFQRRYCWNVGQWRTLLGDVLNVASRRKTSHSLGRLTCVPEDSSKNARLMVIDGQQRNTTAILLLSAIRDIAYNHGDNDGIALSELINNKIFPDENKEMKQWIESYFNTKNQDQGEERGRFIEEGIALKFACLIPTYCDRSSFYQSILPTNLPIVSNENEIVKRPQEAKRFFIGELKKKTNEELGLITKAILFQLEWLFFPIAMGKNFKDGTEDLHIIFERLALRDAMFCRPTRKNESADMGAADFIRNLLLGSFYNEDNAIKMYIDHWLPIEKAASNIVLQEGIADVLEDMFTHFLDFYSIKDENEKGGENNAQPLVPQMIGGMLYARFRAWLIKTNTSNTNTSNTMMKPPPPSFSSGSTTTTGTAAEEEEEGGGGGGGALLVLKTIKDDKKKSVIVGAHIEIWKLPRLNCMEQENALFHPQSIEYAPEYLPIKMETLGPRKNYILCLYIFIYILIFWCDETSYLIKLINHIIYKFNITSSQCDTYVHFDKNTILLFLFFFHDFLYFSFWGWLLFEVIYVERCFQSSSGSGVYFDWSHPFRELFALVSLLFWCRTELMGTFCCFFIIVIILSILLKHIYEWMILFSLIQKSEFLLSLSSGSGSSGDHSSERGESWFVWLSGNIDHLDHHLLFLMNVIFIYRYYEHLKRRSPLQRKRNSSVERQ